MKLAQTVSSSERGPLFPVAACAADLFAIVDLVHGLAEDVRIGLVQRAGLIRIDQAARLLRVGVRPLVDDTSSADVTLQ